MRPDPAMPPFGRPFHRATTDRERAERLQRGALVGAAGRGEPLPETPLLSAAERSEAIAFGRAPRAYMAAGPTPTPASATPIVTSNRLAAFATFAALLAKTMPATSTAPASGAPTMPLPAPDRLASIMSLPEATGRQSLAEHLALQSSLSLPACREYFRRAAIDERVSAMRSPEVGFNAEFEAGKSAAMELRGIRPKAAASERLRIVGGSAMTQTDGDKYEQGRRAAMALRGLN